MTAAEKLAEFATTLTLEEMPEDVAHHAKLHLLDTLGCGLAAQGDARQAVGEKVDPEDLSGQQGQGEAEERPRGHDRDLRQPAREPV